MAAVEAMGVEFGANGAPLPRPKGGESISAKRERFRKSSALAGKTLRFLLQAVKLYLLPLLRRHPLLAHLGDRRPERAARGDGHDAKVCAHPQRFRSFADTDSAGGVRGCHDAYSDRNGDGDHR